MTVDADAYLIVDSYPPDAAGGACFLSLADRGEIIEQRPDGEYRRPEKIVVTPRDLDWDGRVCISERMVRHLAHLFGMYDAWRVETLIAERDRLAAELAEASKRLVRQQTTIDMLKGLEGDEPQKVWVALDGTEHPTRHAAAEHSLRVPDAVEVEPISEEEAPLPEPEVAHA